jgi:hypothetical protein
MRGKGGTIIRMVAGHPSDLAGRFIGSIEVLKKTDRRIGNKPLWLCRCSCGVEFEVTGSRLLEGKRRYCDWRGKHKEDWRRNADANRVTPVADPTLPRKTHTLTWRSWQAMRGRCKYECNDDWHNYGGRGIVVCDRWQDFSLFLEDMGERPSAEHSIERLDVNGNYEPGNCVWGTDDQQRLNRRDTIFIDWDGRRRKFMEVAREQGWDITIVRTRLQNGWPLERAISEPIKRYDKGPKPAKQVRPDGRKSAATLEAMRLLEGGLGLRDVMAQTGSGYFLVYRARAYLTQRGD